MSQTIQADESGALVLPAGLAPPGARFTVEARGEVVILRRDRSTADEWWASTNPAQRVAWLEEWVASLPPGPALPLEATRRDSMYD
jgi:hypothetical protein